MPKRAEFGRRAFVTAAGVAGVNLIMPGAPSISAAENDQNKLPVVEDGVLTGFAHAQGDRNKYRVHFSPDGKNLGSGEIRYEGISPVTAMIPYSGGELTAFTNAGGDPKK